MKTIPCLNCITLSMCKNKSFSQNIGTCTFLHSFLCNNHSVKRLYNKVKNVLNPDLTPLAFSAIVATIQVYNRNSKKMAQNLRMAIDKDIINKIVSEANKKFFNCYQNPTETDLKKMRNLVKRGEYINANAKNNKRYNS